MEVEIAFETEIDRDGDGDGDGGRDRERHDFNPQQSVRHGYLITIQLQISQNWRM